MTLIDTRPYQADTDRHECRAEESRGRYDTNLNRAKPNRRQVNRQQNGDEPVTEIA